MGSKVFVLHILLGIFILCVGAATDDTQSSTSTSVAVSTVTRKVTSKSVLKRHHVNVTGETTPATEEIVFPLPKILNANKTSELPQEESDGFTKTQKIKKKILASNLKNVSEKLVLSSDKNEKQNLLKSVVNITEIFDAKDNGKGSGSVEDDVPEEIYIKNGNKSDIVEVHENKTLSDIDIKSEFGRKESEIPIEGRSLEDRSSEENVNVNINSKSKVTKYPTSTTERTGNDFVYENFGEVKKVLNNNLFSNNERYHQRAANSIPAKITRPSPSVILPTKKSSSISRDNSIKNSIRFENDYYGPTGQTDWIPIIPDKLPTRPAASTVAEFGNKLKPAVGDRLNKTTERNSFVFPSDGVQSLKESNIIPVQELNVEKSTRYKVGSGVDGEKEPSTLVQPTRNPIKFRGSVKYKYTSTNASADDNKFQNETVMKAINSSVDISEKNTSTSNLSMLGTSGYSTKIKPTESTVQHDSTEISVFTVSSSTNNTTKSHNAVDERVVVPPENLKIANITKEETSGTSLISTGKQNESDFTNNLPKLLETNDSWTLLKTKKDGESGNETDVIIPGSVFINPKNSSKLVEEEIKTSTEAAISSGIITAKDTTQVATDVISFYKTTKVSTEEPMLSDVSSQSSSISNSISEKFTESPMNEVKNGVSDTEEMTVTTPAENFISLPSKDAAIKSDLIKTVNDTEIPPTTSRTSSITSTTYTTPSTTSNTYTTHTTPSTTSTTSTTPSTASTASTTPSNTSTTSTTYTTPSTTSNTYTTYMTPSTTSTTSTTPSTTSTASTTPSNTSTTSTTSMTPSTASTASTTPSNTSTTSTISTTSSTTSTASTTPSNTSTTFTTPSTTSTTSTTSSTTSTTSTTPSTTSTTSTTPSTTSTTSTTPSTTSTTSSTTSTTPSTISTTSSTSTTPSTTSTTSTVKPFFPDITTTVLKEYETTEEGIFYKNYIPTTIDPHDDITEENVPAYLRLTVQAASWEELCRLKEDLRDSIIKMLGGNNVSAESVHFLNLNDRNCQEKIEEVRKDSNNTSMFLPVNMFLMDKNGDFDKNLSEAFLTLWGRRGLDFELPIRKVDFVTPIVNLTELADSPLGDSVVAAIIISCVAGICVILLGVLFVIMKRRQKRFNYGQRCTPVSLDAYSLDSVSIHNSVRRKGMRASKRSYGNAAFDDPEVPTHSMNFAGLANFSSDKEQLYEEFNIIPQVYPKVEELPPGAETKNRYANIIPLPETRVHLSVKDGDALSDYINANYVRGLKGVEKLYIACQAPMESTVEDFWRMIWEQQCKVILMLTDLQENGIEKCADYLPPNEVTDNLRLFGDFQVTLKKRDVKEKYIISNLVLKNMEANLWREVTHLWYLGWPNQGVPSEANSLIAFLIEARSQMKIQNGATTSSPAVVHCSPGTGRTGTVIACDLCIREYEQTRMVDIPKCVFNLRRDRAGSVQTKDQYAFIYQVLNVYATKLSGGGIESI